jgi:sterol O-acyltransferase
MKMHSYAFYNGHLSETQRRLASLDKPGLVSVDTAVRYPDPAPSGHPTHQHSNHARSKSVEEVREDLASELTSPLGCVTYPQNLSLTNYIDYIFCPTLCYELEYPRNKNRQWTELAAKALAVFGCIFLLTLTSEEFIVPVLSEASAQLPLVHGAPDKALILAETISMLLFPFMITFLLVFLVIFEYVLGAFAEITRFADRQFYSDWWNSSDWYVFIHFFRASSNAI